MGQDIETRGEKVGFYLICFTSLIPGMIVGGFMPAWNVLPWWVWALIAAAGGLVGGFVATPFRSAGPVGGAVGGAGVILGIWGYVRLRIALSSTFLSLEIVIGALIGALPGFLLYRLLSRRESAPRDE